MEVLFLCGFAFLAGFVDSVVGGGGLIQMPALFLFLPPELSASVVTVSATNKMSSICGTSMAVFQYSRRIPIRWPSILPAGLAAFLFSFLGARTLSLIKPHLLDRKSTRLNSSHGYISYAVFCLKKTNRA